MRTIRAYGSYVQLFSVHRFCFHTVSAPVM